MADVDDEVACTGASTTDGISGMLSWGRGAYHLAWCSLVRMSIIAHLDDGVVGEKSGTFADRRTAGKSDAHIAHVNGGYSSLWMTSVSTQR